MQLDLQSSHLLFTETASEIGGRGSRSQGNREKRLKYAKLHKNQTVDQT